MKKVKLGYNGWANYETWLVSVQGIIDYMQEYALEEMQIAQQISKGEHWEEVYDRNKVDAGFCEEMFETYVEGDIPKYGIVADFVNASIKEIDFREIADHVNDYLEEEAERLDDELRGPGRR
jgi:hypothetical protein